MSTADVLNTMVFSIAPSHGRKARINLGREGGEFWGEQRHLAVETSSRDNSLYHERVAIWPTRPHCASKSVSKSPVWSWFRCRVRSKRRIVSSSEPRLEFNVQRSRFFLYRQHRPSGTLAPGPTIRYPGAL